MTYFMKNDDFTDIPAGYFRKTLGGNYHKILKKSPWVCVDTWTHKGEEVQYEPGTQFKYEPGKYQETWQWSMQKIWY